MAVTYNPFHPDVKADPYPYYAALRKESPVYQIPKTGFYAVSRYDDVAAVLKQPELYSSLGMRVMLMQGMGSAAGLAGTPGVQQLVASAIPDIEMPSPAQILEMVNKLPFSLPELLESRSLIMSDPPVHTPMRALVNRGFTPRRISALEDRIRAMAADAIEQIRGQEVFDLVQELTVPIPVRVIAEMLGVEPDRHDDFKRWSDAIVTGISGGAAGQTPAVLLSAFQELMAYFSEIVERRRLEPRDDLVSVLVAAQEGDTKLTDLEVVMFGVLILAAGNETTTNLIGNAVLSLLRLPEELEKVRKNPDLIPSLVEETLRFDSPVQALFRQVTADTELAGTPLKKDTIVLPLFASANRDEAVFPDPDRFDVTRNPQGHLAFGYGVHFCLGASLARLEARVCLEALLNDLPPFRAVEDQVDRIDSFLLRGPRRLDLTWA
jgi:cytochrome P450